MVFLYPPQLTGVNDKMAEYASTSGVTSQNAALMHTLQRHRDILQVSPQNCHPTAVLVYLYDAPFV